MPSLENLSRHFSGKPFAILGIDLREKSPIVERYVRENGLSYTNLVDTDGEVGALYGVSSTPVKFLIDAKGNMAGAAIGYREWDSDEVKSLISDLMEQTQ